VNQNDKTEQFNELFNRHYTKVFRLCRGYFNGDTSIASDAAQEVFLKVWEHSDSFRQQSNISTWIYRIAVNTCLMYLRKASTSKEIRTETLPDLPAEIYSTEQEEKLKQMYACIQKLDETGKVIILMVLEGISYPEIASITGITEENVRVRIHRIKINLTKCVQYERI
jgi:RNA polymerase sigma factor (sigma-70 family)